MVVHTFSTVSEIIKAHKKPVISYNPASKLVLFQTCAFLPYLDINLITVIIKSRLDISLFLIQANATLP